MNKCKTALQLGGMGRNTGSMSGKTSLEWYLLNGRAASPGKRWDPIHWDYLYPDCTNCQEFTVRNNLVLVLRK